MINIYKNLQDMNIDFLSIKNIAINILLVIGFMGSTSLYAESDKRVLSHFSGVHMRSSSFLEIHQGDKWEVIVDAPQKLLPRVITIVENGILTLYVNADSYYGADEMRSVKFIVTMPLIQKIYIEGTGAEVVANNIISEDLKIKISGYGNFQLDNLTAQNVQIFQKGGGTSEFENVLVSKLYVSLRGSGKLIANGEVGSSQIKVEGSGLFDGEALSISKTSARVYGSGAILVKQTRLVKSKVIGSGEITVINETNRE